MDKIKVVLAYKAFPLAMASYFRRALERRHDVELFTVGEFYGQYIPWGGGMTIPPKYPNQVDLPLPKGLDSPSWEMVERSLPWKPDLVLNVDAGFHFSTKPNAHYAVVATDPHCLGGWYRKVRGLADKFYNMQPFYMEEGDELLPYAFDPTVHFPMNIEKEYDCSLVGLHYPMRDKWVEELRKLGYKVHYNLGSIYDEYREENNRARIGLNWSSLEDVTARVFEIMAMKLVPVLNRLQGLNDLGFEEDRHYLGFSSLGEAVEKVKWAMGNPDQSNQIALNAYQKVTREDWTYDARIRQILATSLGYYGK